MLNESVSPLYTVMTMPLEKPQEEHLSEHHSGGILNTLKKSYVVLAYIDLE